MELCIICIRENPITADNPLTQEHIIPEFIGGSLAKKNVCKSCNSSMGTGFEGALANSLFYKLPRFIHNIKGKKQSLENPFTGVYDHEEVGRFRVNKNGDLTVIPDITIEQLDDGFAVNMSIDKSEFEKAKPLLEKKILRHLKSQDREINKAKISKGVDKILEKASQKHNKVDSPEIKGRILIDIDAQIMLYSKIAYELAVFHFGDSYITDPIADKLRVMLKTQTPDNTLRGQFLAEDDGYNNFFDSENHWVMFIKSACFIQLFGFPAVVMYAEEGSKFQAEEGVVYKFCYKSQKYEVISLIEHLSGLTRPSI
ncbi:HNH endonuclease [Psychrobacter sp. AOP7-A1-24]|uniref:HNH endonuclease n=1 Tax=Psychrobacter sp. AOP7-A1-24 TaxID=3457646 RepID=UPI00402BC245